jgi:hypothetical protein
LIVLWKSNNGKGDIYMSKKESKKGRREITDDVDEVTQEALGSDIGSVPEELEARLEEADPMESIPCFVPGKPGFEEGKTLGGYYVSSKKVYSQKFKAGKKDDAGKKYRLLHVFKDAKERAFGIWGVGHIDWVMKMLLPKQFIAITYEGLAEESLKEGQNPPHKFSFKGIDLKFDPESMREHDEMDRAGATLPANRTTQEPNLMRQ